MREIYKLTAKGLNSLPLGKHEDGGGLRLVKRADAGAWWVHRYSIHGRRREMGLGTYPFVSLAEARRIAEGNRAMLRAGKDPIRERERQRQEAARGLHLLKDVARDAFEAKKTNLKGDGKAGRWFSPIELHILPKLGDMPVAEITQADIRDCLKPIWQSKAETADKALTRLGFVIKQAAALGLDVDMQVTAKAKALLGEQHHETTHVPALPWAEVPAFYKTLGENTGELALRLLILTGVRSASLRFLHEDHIDGDVWTIPAELMKGHKGKTTEFRVPLVPEALAIIEKARMTARDGFLFTATRKGVISDATMARIMERRDMEARPHGFRSSLRDWIAENQPDTPHEVAEMMLAHKTDSVVVRSYRRADFLDQRRVLLERWADHVTGKAKPNAANDGAAETARSVAA